MIEIKDKFYGSSFFNIQPVKVKNINEDTNDMDNVEECRELCISIEEDDIWAYLFPVILKYYNDDLEENKKRYDVDKTKYNIGEETTFEWYLTYNYFTFEDMNKIINELKKIIILLQTDFENGYLDEIKKNYYKTDIKEIVSFYERFIEKVNHMMNESEKDGYRLISFMGP